jgi:hypothetical protein
MAKKSFFWGMLGMVLALSFAVSGCDTGTNDTPEEEEILTDETDKTALATVISNAENALAAATVDDSSPNFAAIFDSIIIISTSDKADYEAAVNAAKTVNDSTAATQAQVDGAIPTLSAAIAGKIKTGTKVGAIGDTGPAGGKIFYVDAADAYPGWKYLEAAPADLAGNYTWASSGYRTTNIYGTATGIGSGAANTTTILATDANAPSAKACADYTYGGYDDWFLPSKDDVSEMYTYRTTIGSFVGSGYYWSSSDILPADASAWLVNFNNGNPVNGSKVSECLVRAVRAF